MTLSNNCQMFKLSNFVVIDEYNVDEVLDIAKSEYLMFKITVLMLLSLILLNQCFIL